MKNKKAIQELEQEIARLHKLYHDSRSLQETSEAQLKRIEECYEGASMTHSQIVAARKANLTRLSDAQRRLNALKNPSTP